jgi:hypothetical protein
VSFHPLGQWQNQNASGLPPHLLSQIRRNQLIQILARRFLNTHISYFRQASVNTFECIFTCIQPLGTGTYSSLFPLLVPLSALSFCAGLAGSAKAAKKLKAFQRPCESTQPHKLLLRFCMCVSTPVRALALAPSRYLAAVHKQWTQRAVSAIKLVRGSEEKVRRSELQGVVLS